MKLSFSLRSLIPLSCLLSSFSITPSHAHETLCMLIADAKTGTIIKQSGKSCDAQITPASSSKIFFAVAGFDSGFLKDKDTPSFPYKKEYDGWLETWKQDIEPTLWLKYSVVWYTRLIAQELGQEKLENYASQFHYGNADFSGDKGKNNALIRSWISSSLKISPNEQKDFLSKLVTHTLPVSPSVSEQVMSIVEKFPINKDWIVQGKTGMAYPRKKDQSFDESKAYGWFVGWAKKNDDAYVFVNLIQDTKKEEPYASYRSRDEMLKRLSEFLSQESKLEWQVYKRHRPIRDF